MRKFQQPGHLSQPQLALLVAALQEFAASRQDHAQKADDSLLTQSLHDQVVEAWELLARLDPEGERQEANFTEWLHQRARERDD